MGGLSVDSSAIYGLIDDELARRWLNAVYAWTRTQRAFRVQDGLRAPGPAWNYYVVQIVAPTDSPLHLLLNAAARVVACTRDVSVPTCGPLTFVDVVGAEVFENAGFAVCTSADLRRALGEPDLAAFTAAQREDIRYHQAESVGDALFNWFD